LQSITDLVFADTADAAQRNDRLSALILELGRSMSTIQASNDRISGTTTGPQVPNNNQPVG
jgi:hypothetical protein